MSEYICLTHPYLFRGWVVLACVAAAALFISGVVYMCDLLEEIFEQEASQSALASKIDN